MFQASRGGPLLPTSTFYFLSAVAITGVPTAVLLGVIAARTVATDGGALLVDASLGTILVFSSIAAVIIPWIYRIPRIFPPLMSAGPLAVLYATHLAKAWIEASAQTSLKSAAFLPSTPQYLLSVGNLGLPGIVPLWDSLRYYNRRRTRVSPILSHSTFGLAILMGAAAMVLIGDVWLHTVSSTVLEPTALRADHLRNFSRGFAPPVDLAAVPWQLQQGLQTFLDANPVSKVLQLNNSLVILPSDVPPGTSVLGTTLGVETTCDLATPKCAINTTALRFDCSSIQPGALGSTGPVNVTLFPSGNATTFNLFASMALPSLFNSSSTLLAVQVFQCSGSLLNITYILRDGQYNITKSTAIDVSPLTSFWNLSTVTGKSELVGNILDSIGKSATWIQEGGLTTTPSIFASGFSKLSASFLAGQTVPIPSLKESSASDRILSRVPLAPIVFLGVNVVSILGIVSYVGWRALRATTSPPRLNGNQISINNLHQQLTSPMSVLASALGDTPLAMRVLFNGQDQGRVQFDRRADTALREDGGDDGQSLVGDKVRVMAGSRQSDLGDGSGYEGRRSVYRGVGEDEEAGAFMEVQPRPPPQDLSPSPELDVRPYEWNQ